jgi:glycosyltransferase involved in cell wall biosynthesis
MISVIISSANPTYLKDITENVENTIGVAYEIIADDNSDGKKGICEVYNNGIKKAQYDILCFMHEDIEIKTNDWGKKLISYFEQDHELGLVGIAGSSYKPLTPSTWGGRGFAQSIYVNVIQSYKFTDKPDELVWKNPFHELLSRVACLDGVFLCTTKRVTDQIKFDEHTFKGFHGYDIDFSLAVAEHYKIAVTFEIALAHFSEGRFDRTWMEENLRLHDKWYLRLPVHVQNLTEKQVLTIEKQTFKLFIDQLIQLKFPMKVALTVLQRGNKFKQLSVKLYLKLHFYIFKKYLLAKRT